MSKKIIPVIALLAISMSFHGCEKAESSNGAEAKEKEFFKYLADLSQDQKQRFEYSNIIEKFAHILKEEVKKDPKNFSSFFEETIPIVVAKNNPGCAILVEEYASEALREEIRRQCDNNKAELLKKDETISNLEKRKYSLEIENAALRAKEIKIKPQASQNPKTSSPFPLSTPLRRT